jgi:hypothetical protein
VVNSWPSGDVGLDEYAPTSSQHPSKMQSNLPTNHDSPRSVPCTLVILSAASARRVVVGVCGWVNSASGDVGLDEYAPTSSQHPRQNAIEFAS